MTSMRFPLFRTVATIAASASLVAGAAAAAAAEPPTVTRCGWFSNPTPQNAWLRDREAEWTISVQGGFQAEGDWPSFTRSQWIRTNGNYGYGCACMSVVSDSRTNEITVIRSARARPLAACRKDPALKKPS